MKNKIKIIKKLFKKNKLIYLLLYLYIFVFVFVFTITFNTAISLYKDYNLLLDSQRNNQYYFNNVYNKNLGVAISKEKLIKLLNTDSSEIVVYYDLIIQNLLNENKNSITIQYTNEVDKIYISQTVKNFLLSHNEKLYSNVDIPFVIKDNKLVFKYNENIDIRLEEDFMNEYIIKIPVEYFYKNENITSNIDYRIKVKINSKKLDELTEKLFAIRNELNSDPNYLFKINDELFINIAQIREFKQKAHLFMFYSIGLLITFLTGLVIIFVFLFQKVKSLIEKYLVIDIDESHILPSFILEFGIILCLPTIFVLLILKLFMNEIHLESLIIPSLKTITIIFILLGLILIMLIFLIPTSIKLYRLKVSQIIEESKKYT